MFLFIHEANCGGNLIHILFFCDISKVYIKFVWQLDANGAQGCLHLFPQPCCLASWLTAFLARQHWSDRQAMMMTVIRDGTSLHPIHTTVEEKGAGAENGQQRGKSEYRYWNTERFHRDLVRISKISLFVPDVNIYHGLKSEISMHIEYLITQTNSNSKGGAGVHTAHYTPFRTWKYWE